MQRTSIRFWAVTLCFLVAGLASSAMATSSFAPLKIEELTERSSDIVVGRVAGFQSVAEGNQIFTYVEIRIDNVWKGKGQDKGGRLIVRMLGGVASGLRMRVIGAPCFRRDEEVALFLTKDGSGALSVASLAEGKFSIVRDRTSATVVRDLSGIEFSQNTSVEIPKTLDELERAVRAATR
jgi:hypothetical protein